MRIGVGPHRLHGFHCLGFAAAAGLAWPVLQAEASGQGTAYIVWHLLLTLLMLGAWRAGVLRPLAAQHATLAAGIAARLMLLAVPAFTTHDVERYLWDGAVALAGLDPYRVAPDAPVVAGLRAWWPTPAEHAAYPTLYPPGALALYALCASAGPVWGLVLWKLCVTAASVATMFVVRAVLARRGALQHLPLVALSPLLVLEAGVGAHVDAFSTLAVAAALCAFDARRPALVGVALGLGTLVKLLPLVVLLPLGLSLAVAGRWQALGRLMGASVLVIGAGYTLALALGLQPVGILPLFFERWRFGSPLFAAAQALWPDAAVGALMGLLAATLLAAAAAWARTNPLAGVQLALAAPLLTSPVVFPWYLCVLVPLCAMQPRAWLLAWFSAAPLSYEVLNGFAAAGVWAPAGWPLWLIAAAVAAGIGLHRRAPHAA